MHLFEGIDALQGPLECSTVAIGAFDGIHVGHQAIVRAAVEDARANNRPAVVFTFDRHPAELLRPERAPDYLTTPDQRISLIEQLGADVLIVAQFDATLSHLKPDQFVRRILLDLLGAKCVVVGADFRFGENRAGNVPFLQHVCGGLGFDVIALAPVAVNEKSVSSTRIRELIEAGDMAAAEEALGHPYLLSGLVVSGRKMGRTLGFPTANLERTWRQVIPKDGIYAVRVFLEDGRKFGGACSIGVRPTITEDTGGRSIETYLFDFDEDIYGRKMEIQFVKFLRPEVKFNSLDELKAQIAIDVDSAKIITQRQEDTIKNPEFHAKPQ